MKRRAWLSAILLVFAGPSHFRGDARGLQDKPAPTITNHFGESADGPIYQDEPRRMVEGPDGCLYSTSSGNLPTNQSHGVFYKITPEGKVIDLYKWDGVVGKQPRGGLSLGRDDLFDGTTRPGGKYGMGTVFRISADAKRMEVLWDFRAERESFRSPWAASRRNRSCWTPPAFTPSARRFRQRTETSMA